MLQDRTGVKNSPPQGSSGLQRGKKTHIGLEWIDLNSLICWQRRGQLPTRKTRRMSPSQSLRCQGMRGTIAEIPWPQPPQPPRRPFISWNVFSLIVFAGDGAWWWWSRVRQNLHLQKVLIITNRKRDRFINTSFYVFVPFCFAISAIVFAFLFCSLLCFLLSYLLFRLLSIRSSIIIYLLSHSY